ncbi:hypothetical protein L615_003600000240 [Nocardioides sp. J9]|uniref:WXG100-like domain-containing protein n=2 Tax=unclassified Nocardioides TaxID=2615069 RepID=UPI0004B9F5A4|nr:MULTISPECIES: hypothetical protein [unclassified Nocardioides]TWG97358.1 hypothetical protein L615_003600000240 [Nocardioides sp. J9]
MGMMLPDELVWILDKLGYEWPDVDEDEVRRGATLVRQLGSDLEACIQAVDRKVNSDLAASMRGKSGPAYVAAWNTNRSQNLQQLLDFMDPAATGMEVAADLVVGLKVKVIAELTITLAQLIPLLAAGPFGAGGAALLVIAKKKLMDALVNIAIEQALEQVIPMVAEPLMEQLPAVIDAVLDAPMVEGVVGDTDEYFADLEALEQASSDLELAGADLDSITSQFVADWGNLDFGGDA